MNSTFLTLAALLFSLSIAWTKPDNNESINVADIANGVRITCETGTVYLQLLGTNILRADVQPGNKTSSRTQVLDPSLKLPILMGVTVISDEDQTVIRSALMIATVTHSLPLKISVTQADGHKLLEQVDIFKQAQNHQLILYHTFGENIYGMSGLGRLDNGGGLLRNNGSEVFAGSQGEGGAPFFFSTRYGVLIDSDGGTFFTEDSTIDFQANSRADVEYFVIIGRPLEVISGLAILTGHPPMPPKWTLGFLNSQWGSDEMEIKQLAATYRQKNIPIDAFILDYDWKAWGEDGYGEWRWNSTSGPGNQAPNKFPDGASGGFARDMRVEGIKLAGILKPRILVDKNGSTNELDEAAAFAEAHGLWYPGEPPSKERPMIRNLDLGNPGARSWYWKHLEPAFDSGIVAWWNDEADHCYAQLTHAIGLNDVCDALRLHSGRLSAVRGATPPSKNALSTANRERSAQMAQDLFYAVLGHLETLHPGFGRDRRPRFAFRFKRVIHLVDATTIQRVARCLD